MSRFRRSEPREVPSLNTASLPDLIFTLLFFFMIVTNMRDVPVRLQYKVPDATELQKLKEKSLVTYIIVGQTDPPTIQINSDFVSLEEMPAYLKQIREKTAPEDRDKMVAALRIHKETKMGLVSDIKQILRESQILTVHYAADKKGKK